MGESIDSHLHPLTHDHVGPKVISVSNDSNSKKVFGHSLPKGVSSCDSLEYLLFYINGEVSQAEVSLPLPF